MKDTAMNSTHRRSAVARSRRGMLAALLVGLPLSTAMHSTDESASVSLPSQQVVDLTNQARAAGGCEPLTVHPALEKAADTHAADMARGGYLDHTSRDGRSPFDRMRAAGAPGPGSMAENIASGQRAAAEVVDGWMHSAGHRKNIVNCRLQWIGIGIHTSGQTTYWVQNFSG